VDSYFVSSS